jgi:hypothetical protein
MAIAQDAKLTAEIRHTVRPAISPADTLMARAALARVPLANALAY